MLDPPMLDPLNDPSSAPAPTRRAAAMLEIHVAVFLFGTAAVLAKLTELSSVEIVLGRTFFAAATLLWIVPALGRRPWRLPRGQLAAMVPLGALLALHWYSFFQSVIVSSVAVGLITFSTFPLFTMLLEPYVFSTRRRGRDVIQACCIVAGVALVIPEYDLGNQVTAGAAWGLASGLSFALLQVLNRRFVQGTSAIELSLGQNLVAFLLLILVFGSPSVGHLNRTDWLILIVLGILCTALAHTLFIRGLDTVSAQTASVITGLEPVYGIALAMLVLGEIPAVRTAVGGAVVLGTVIFATRASTAADPTPGPAPAPEPASENRTAARNGGRRG